MSKKRTRHPDEPRIDKFGRMWNGRSHHPIKYSDKAEANQKKHENGPAFPGADGPSSKALAIIASGAILRPSQIAGIRQSIVNVVEKNIRKAENVLEGTETWTAPQTQLFLKLLDKVAPNMSETMHRHTMQPASSDYSRMSMTDLEAALRDVLKEPEVIDVEPEPEREVVHRTPAQLASNRRRYREKQLSIKEVAARQLERPETILPPLTRARDNENRRQAKASAKGLRKRQAKAAILHDLKLMGQMDAKPEPE